MGEQQKKKRWGPCGRSGAGGANNGRQASSQGRGSSSHMDGMGGRGEVAWYFFHLICIYISGSLLCLHYTPPFARGVGRATFHPPGAGGACSPTSPRGPPVEMARRTKRTTTPLSRVPRPVSRLVSSLHFTFPPNSLRGRVAPRLSASQALALDSARFRCPSSLL
jgi:hypothetical protein